MDNEKPDAIVAEMRKEARSKDLFNGEEVGEPLIRGGRVEEWADRLEAALKRDAKEVLRETLKVASIVDAIRRFSEPGPLNTAAMRRALEEARDFALQIERVTIEADVGYDAGEIVETCEEALKAPARNCERFASWEEAKAAFWKEVGDPCDWRKLGAWLFAKVEKEEGAE